MNTDSLTDTSALAPEGAARRARKEARRNQLLRAAGAVLDELTERVPAAVAAADEDPVERASAVAPEDRPQRRPGSPLGGPSQNPSRSPLLDPAENPPRNPLEMRRRVMTAEHEFEDILYEIRGAAAVTTMN